MNTVRARTIGEEDSIRLRDILSSDVHPAVKSYFKAEVEKLLQQERAKEVRSARFPYGIPEVKGLQRQIDLSLVNQYEFDRQEFESLLDESVHFQFNYLCRPRWTLQEFMFENRRTMSVTEIMRKLKYCVEYRYIGEIFKRYVSNRGLAEIGYEEFRALIEKIDTEVVSKKSAGELARMLRPLVDFVEVGIPETRISESGPVLPINAAIVFFEDKRMDEMRVRLEEERDKNDVKDVSIADIARLIREVKGEEAQEETSPPPVPTVMTEVPPAKHLEAPSKTQGKLSETPASPLPGKILPQKKKDQERAHIEDVYSLFSLKEQKLFVRKMFRKDDVEFRNALDKLNPLSTWKEASLVLDEIFSANDVDPFSKEAVLFTDKIFGRYAVTDPQEK